MEGRVWKGVDNSPLSLIVKELRTHKKYVMLLSFFIGARHLSCQTKRQYIAAYLN